MTSHVPDGQQASGAPGKGTKERGVRRRAIEGLPVEELARVDQDVGINKVRRIIVVDNDLIDASVDEHGLIEIEKTKKGAMPENLCAAEKRKAEATNALFNARYHAKARIDSRRKETES